MKPEQLQDEALATEQWLLPLPPTEPQRHIPKLSAAFAAKTDWNWTFPADSAPCPKS
jgi:hypothetical protein